MLVVIIAMQMWLIARFVPRLTHLATVMFVMLHLGTGLTLFPQRVTAATSGLPRRYTEADGFFALANRVSIAGTVMAFIALCGITVAALVALYRIWAGRKSR
jgi:hypothetical protein